jgi:drug/metabolite transporter (DMT)-like permease
VVKADRPDGSVVAVSSSTTGVVLKLAATLVFTIMVVMIKIAAERVPAGELVFARSAFGTIPILVMLALRGELVSALRTRHPFGHVRRAFVGTASMFCWFASLGYLPIPDATAINYSGPLFGVIFAAVILGEKVRIYRWTAVLVGFVGVLIVLSEQVAFGEGLTGERTLGGVLALLAALFAALAMITVRQLTATETTGAIVFYFSASAAVLSLASLPFGWVVPDATTALLLVGAGLVGGIGQVLLTEAYRHAEASVIAPFDYANMIWVVIAAYVVFGDVPTVTVLAGSAIVIASGVFVIWRERRLGILESRAAARRAGAPQ